HWGGYTDRAIEAWHGLVGAFNFERSRFPRNQIHLALGDEGGTAFRIDGTTPTVGDVVLRNQASLFEGGDPLSAGEVHRYGLAARLDLKLPTGPLSRAGGPGGFVAPPSGLVPHRLAGQRRAPRVRPLRGLPHPQPGDLRHPARAIHLLAERGRHAGLESSQHVAFPLHEQRTRRGGGSLVHPAAPELTS